MADLDKLEKLNRLKEAGALTEVEFDQQKFEILSGRRVSTNTRIGVLFGLLVLLAAIVWFATRSEDADVAANAVQTVQGDTAAPIITTSDTPVQKDTSPVNILNFATSDAVIGVNPAYLEEKLGVPREKNKGSLVFELGGCKINYAYDDSGVTGFYLKINSSCRPVIRGRQVGPETSFGSLLGKETWGQFVASCLTSCGNAADPVIDLTYPGSRATRFISISYSTDYSQAGDALQLWEQSLRKTVGLSEFEVPEDFDTFFCVHNPPADVRRLLPRMTVQTVSVSIDDAPAC